MGMVVEEMVESYFKALSPNLRRTEARENSQVRIAFLRTEIRTRELQGTKHKLYLLYGVTFGEN
jgi:hypothetical protein